MQEVRAMASTFEIHARHRWTFRLVLLGSRLQLEGCRQAEGLQQEPMHCSAWLDPQDAPRDVAHHLMARPSCALWGPRFTGAA